MIKNVKKSKLSVYTRSNVERADLFLENQHIWYVSISGETVICTCVSMRQKQKEQMIVRRNLSK